MNLHCPHFWHSGLSNSHCNAPSNCSIQEILSLKFQTFPHPSSKLVSRGLRTIWSDLLQNQIPLSVFIFCISYFSHCRGRIHDKNGLNKEELIYCTVQGCSSSLGMETWQQECMVAGHTAPTVKKQGAMNTGAPFSSSLYSFMRSAHWMLPPTFKVGLPISISPV